MSNLTFRILLSSLFVVFALSGCGSSGGDESPAPDTNTDAPTVNLTSDAYTVDLNSSVTLSWSSKFVDGCTASGTWDGIKSIDGNETVGPLTEDVTFTLYCTGTNGGSADSVSIIVNGDSLPIPTLSLQASSDIVSYNGSTVLSWVSTNAIACYASGDWTGDKSLTGSQTIDSLTQNSTFILSCTGENGTANYSVDISVLPPVSPTVSLSASANTVESNGSTILNWSSTDATSCVASGDWSGDKAVSGSQTISSIISDSVFNLSCSGPSGSVSNSVSVTVVSAAIPTVTLSASLSSVPSNGSTTLNWSSTDATSCVASGDWSGDKAVSGSQTISSLILDSVFNLSCSGPGGTANDSVNVSVVVSNNGTALLSWVPPTSNTDESTLTDLAGYKIYYGTSSGVYSNTVTVNNPGLTSYLVESLGANTWYFAMTSFNSLNIESAQSLEVSKMIN